MNISKYIIMCGGQYSRWTTPKQLNVVNGEPIVARTIRLLKAAGVVDISISSNHEAFDNFGIPVLHHENTYGKGGMWIEAFYPTDEPVCYICGDVVFSPEAINTIVNTDTDDIEFFASRPPFDPRYIKPWAEPFAFKVRNQKHLKESLLKVRELRSQFKREPISWEVWQVIKGTPINIIDYNNYIAINDYTCDVDSKADIDKFNALFAEINKGD